MRSVKNIVVFLALLPAVVSAQHAIDVERAAAEGSYLTALRMYETLPKRSLTPAARLAAAQSAWGLSLVQQARSELETLERIEKLDPLLRGQVLLSRATLEFQERQLDVAELFLSKFTAHCEKFHCGSMQETAALLAADISRERGDVAKAKNILTTILESVRPTQSTEAYYRRAQCNKKLALLDEARADLSQIPLSDPRAPDALRLLALILVDQGNFNDAAAVLTRARAEYPKQFLDSWSDYVIVTATLKGEDPERWRNLQGEIVQRFPPSEPWVALLNAATEAKEWQTAGGEHDSSQ